MAPGELHSITAPGELHTNPNRLTLKNKGLLPNNFTWHDLFSVKRLIFFNRKLFAQNPASSMIGYFYKDVAYLGFNDWNEHGEWLTIHGNSFFICKDDMVPQKWLI